ncbi:MAG: phytanoyl-CoA dioxygenase family protein [Alphaproteobacteria bacterium]|nr:phytanoyl-CoA dioxygenase family protein [Alphaproteobacteria bacterium]
MITPQQLDDFQRDGAVLLKGAFTEWVEKITAAIQANLDSPGEYAAENTKQDDTGRFFDDYCNWQRLPEIEDVIMNSPAPQLAAELMQSETARVFHDHVLVKEPGTSKETPWHQDAPYYFIEGQQNISFWIPVDPVQDATLRLIAGSHLWDKMVLPVRWLNEDDFYAGEDSFRPVPRPGEDGEDYTILEWPMEPGDAVAFHYKTAHGARANLATTRRRALSLRYVGDDAQFITRPGRTSPPFPGHGMTDGEALRDDWFPIAYSK